MGRILDKLARLDRKGRAKLIALTIAAAICLGVALASVIQILSTQAERSAAEQEYSGMRQQYSPDAQSVANSAPDSTPVESEPPKEPWEINADYAGWIQAGGAGVDLPVVQGADNTRYLTTTFEGSYNSAGQSSWIVKTPAALLPGTPSCMATQ